MNKGVLRVLVAIVAVLALVSCGGQEEPAPVSTGSSVSGYAPNQTAVGYAYTHGGYVGKAEVSTGADGALSVMLDEAFLPHTLAVVDMESGDWTEDNTVFYIQRGEEVRVAEYVSYNDTMYVGTTVGGSLTYVEADEAGAPVGGTDLEKAILRNQMTMEAYFDGIADGAFAVYTEFGGDAMTVTTTSYGGFYKSDGGYWNFGDLGWQGNMDAIAAFAVANGTGFAMDEMVRNDDNVWEVADATTGATASDFRDYYTLIQLAAGRLAVD